MTGTAGYGIRETDRAEDAVSAQAELVRREGYAVLDSGLSRRDLARLARALDRLHGEQQAALAEMEAPGRTGEEGIVRAPLACDPLFIELAACPPVLSLAARLLDGYVVLSQQNGIINPPLRGCGQSAWHRDLPYQHFVASRPLALGALFCLDPFTGENGATLVLPGSHRSEAFPPEAAVRHSSRPVLAPAGAVILFDAMLYHRAGDNSSGRPRRAVNHVYGRAFLRQQLDLPAMLEGRHADDPHLARLLGYDDRPPASLAAWRAQRGRKAGAALG